MRSLAWISRCGLFLALAAVGFPAEASLPGTHPLTMQGDFSAQMVAGIDRFLNRELAQSPEGRAGYWRPDFSSREGYEKSVQANRDRLAHLLGAIDPRVANPEMELVATVAIPARAAETDKFMAHAVRWPVLEGVFGEGLLLQPKGRVVARVVAVPDADQLPETLAGIGSHTSLNFQYARRLAENGCQVIVPVLADRADTHSGNPRIERLTNQPHREWIYRQSFTLGRHIIGYEVQKIRAAVDWLIRQNQGNARPVGVAGWGEGGLLALYAAALDPRIDAALVSGYFGPREDLWREPIYRNVFGLVREFGDAGVARLVAPRKLLIEHAPAPDIQGPPPPTAGRIGAAPGRIATPTFEQVRDEADRAKKLIGPFTESIGFIHGNESSTIGPFAESTLLEFLRALHRDVSSLAPAGPQPVELRRAVDHAARQMRTVRAMQQFSQRTLQLAAGVREEFLWKKTAPTTPQAWQQAMRAYREKYWNEVIGRFPTGQTPLNPRSRQIREGANWTLHEVVLDVLPDVFAWGYFIVPKGIKPGERRPVVVAQHGLEGLPQSVIEDNPTERTFRTYKAYALQLAERGFIVFAPHNPYRGGDAFRVLQRKANPLGKSLFGIIVAQHDRILDWLSSQPNVDPARIGFYGLSYGGNSAMVMPAILERYAVSVNSGCFNEFIWKHVSTDWRSTYVFTGEYEKPDFNLGQTFGDAEIAALIAPRPFMVERGHNDGVGLDEWVAYEYAKVNRLYAKLKIPERTEIDFFMGVHEIHGAAAFEFLHRHLDWPAPRQP